MKFTKMSLITALLIGSSAFAIDNVQVSGDANVFYHTQDADMTPNVLSGDSATLFGKDNSAADASLNLAISADLVGNDLVKVSGNAAYTIISTLGLENNFVSNVWGASHSATVGTGAGYAGSEHSGAFGGAKVENASWMTEAYVTVAMQAATKSTVMLGRMPLDTPLAFTETWSIEKNTFEAAVLVNQDIPGTTVVGAWVGNGNGGESLGQDASGAVSQNSLAMGAVVNEDGKFTTLGTDGAYALGVVNNSFEPLTAQAWYYDLVKVGTSFWLQADLNCKLVPGLMAGVQYTQLDLDGFDDTGSAYAAMLGYELKDMVTVKGSFSQTDKNVGILGNAGTVSGDLGYRGQSKLYTEAWWMYGYVAQADTTGMNLTVESPVNGLFDLGVYYTQTTADAGDMRDLTITAGKEFGPLAATLAFINYEVENEDAVNNIQAYLTLSF